MEGLGFLVDDDSIKKLEDLQAFRLQHFHKFHGTPTHYMSLIRKTTVEIARHTFREESSSDNGFITADDVPFVLTNFGFDGKGNFTLLGGKRSSSRCDSPPFCQTQEDLSEVNKIRIVTLQATQDETKVRLTWKPTKTERKNSMNILYHLRNGAILQRPQSHDKSGPSKHMPIPTDTYDLRKSCHSRICAGNSYYIHHQFM